MEQKTTSIWKSGLILGVYLAIIIILYSVILYVTGMGFNKIAGYASIAILVIGVVIIQISYKKQQDNILTYGQGVGVAVISMLSVGVISMVYTYLLYAVIDPDYYQQFLLFMEEQTMATLLDREMSEDQIQMSLDMQQKFQTPVILAGGALINTVIVGLIVSLISSIFIKKNPSDEVPE
ncbi:MAG: DUF4199 family protein [Draconibacterium sp.]|nr:DUF4199 family protein [Draconibacterium sp.]